MIILMYRSFERKGINSYINVVVDDLNDSEKELNSCCLQNNNNK